MIFNINNQVNMLRSLFVSFNKFATVFRGEMSFFRIRLEFFVQKNPITGNAPIYFKFA